MAISAASPRRRGLLILRPRANARPHSLRRSSSPQKSPSGFPGGPIFLSRASYPSSPRKRKASLTPPLLLSPEKSFGLFQGPHFLIAGFLSFVPAQTRGLTHSAAPPLPRKVLRAFPGAPFSRRGSAEIKIPTLSGRDKKLVVITPAEQWPSRRRRRGGGQCGQCGCSRRYGRRTWARSP